MPVNSAQELHDLIGVLSKQFGQVHHPLAHQIWSDVDGHIEHVVQEGGQWIGRAIGDLHSDWQSHKLAFQNAATWFDHHTAALASFAERAHNLSTEVLVGAAAGAAGAAAVARVFIPDAFKVGEISHKTWEMLHGKTMKSLVDFDKIQGLDKEKNIIKYFSHPYKFTAEKPGPIGIALDGAKIGYDVYTKGWGDGETVKDTVNAVGGTVATSIAGPLGGVAWQAGAGTGEYLGNQLENDFQIQEKVQNFIFGDPDHMTSAQAAKMVHDVSNPISFGNAAGHAVWHKLFS